MTNESITLEDLREDDIGSISAFLPEFEGRVGVYVHLTYMQFSKIAFYNSMEQIKQLEFSETHIQQGNSIQTTVGAWFLSIEAYLNSILKIACLVNNQSFDDIKKKDINQRITELFIMLKIEKKPFYRSTFQKLEEFKRYRNELFHDRTNDKAIKFKKTLFSANPMYANQVDVMQASIIALEIYHSFRYVIPELDLMPQIVVNKEDSHFYAKVDNLYNEVLKPYFLSTLEKHSLTSSVDLNFNMEALKTSSALSAMPIKILIKSVRDEKYQTIPTKKITQIGKDFFDSFLEKTNFDTRNFFLTPNFYR